MKLRNVLWIAGICLLAGAPTASRAAAIYQLTSDHCSGGGCLGTATSAGTVSVTDNGNGSLTFAVALNGGFQFVSTGFQTDFGFNLSPSPTITYSGVTSGFAATGGSPQSAGTLMMDGAGQFGYGITCTACGNGGSNPQAGPLNFTIAAAGLTLASLAQNANGQFFAVDLIGAGGRTGAVDASVCQSNCGGPPNSVPEPQTLALIGLGLIGLAGIRKRRAI
jgi:hypothetical protein